MCSCTGTNWKGIWYLVSSRECLVKPIETHCSWVRPDIFVFPIKSSVFWHNVNEYILVYLQWSLFNRHGFAIPRVLLSCFEISEVDMRESFLTMASLWNSPSHVTRILAQGSDWSTFLKVWIKWNSFLFLWLKLVYFWSWLANAHTYLPLPLIFPALPVGIQTTDGLIWHRKI